MWNFGSILGIVLMVQVLRGLLLTFHYVAHRSLSFEVSDYITREVPGGFSLRILHLNGATLYFCCLYVHIFRGLKYGSYKRKKTWLSGTASYLGSIAVAFLGYVLPWGQISYWGASVITNIVATIPILGAKLIYWVWGRFRVGSATLTFFYSLHFIIPETLLMIRITHLFYLHERGRSTPQNLHSSHGNVRFSPYYTYKDLLNLIPILLCYTTAFFHPWIMGDTENWNTADPIKSPLHIQPEWYFLFAYAILRSIPNKLGGTLALISRVAILVIIPNTRDKKKKTGWSNQLNLGLITGSFFFFD
jgi:ubiquinol-cytochrome c reductase cytochrome b subunit